MDLKYQQASVSGTPTRLAFELPVTAGCGPPLSTPMVWMTRWVEREDWINNLTISNVLTKVPDHALIFDKP